MPIDPDIQRKLDLLDSRTRDREPPITDRQERHLGDLLDRVHMDLEEALDAARVDLGEPDLAPGIDDIGDLKIGEASRLIDWLRENY